MSHACWRAPGISIFLPTDEPEGDELPGLLAARATAQRIDSVPALRSSNALLVQAPWLQRHDLLAMLRRNPRSATAFPDLLETLVSVSRLRSLRGDPAVIVEEEGAIWPEGPAAWSSCEINRVDIVPSQLFELPFNLGQMGPRATVLADVLGEARRQSAATLVVDLGERDGDVGVERVERARIDYTALQRLGYSLAVPFEFELALGAEALGELNNQFPQIRFLAANVKAKENPDLFEAHRMVEIGGVKLGLFGIVDPDVRGQLPRATLDDYTFESALDAARREAHPRDNATIAHDVAGIDAIVADLHVRWSPESMRIEVELPDRPRSRPGSPALVARGFANGLGVGRLDLTFRPRPDGDGRFLASVSHALESVTDRTPADTALVAEIRAMTNIVKRPRGDLMFPSFVDLTERHPELKDFDETTNQGRVSQPMWEEFLARLLRNQGRAEIAIIPTLSHFPPLIGKLHEEEVRSWLWGEDEIVLLDLQGADVQKVLLEDTRGELVVSGIDRTRWTVGGRRLNEQEYYRVATTDVLFEGARFRDFQKARRVRRNVRVSPEGVIEGAGSETRLTLRNFMLAELRRLRAVSRNNEDHIDRIAARLAPDQPYENLLAFSFDRPTFWVSLNRIFNNESYGAVPESRVTAVDSWVAGFSGRFKLTYDRQTFTPELGLTVAYARQAATLADGSKRITESADDLKVELTLRPKALGRAGGTVHPFVRTVFDTEFTPTTDFATGLENPHQLALRGVVGVMFTPTRHWRNLELAAAIENGFSQPNLQLGFQGRADFTQRIGPLGSVVYRLRNDAIYFLPATQDTESHLALRYNMVHELLIPLVDELSLSVSADLFFFQGKVETTRAPGASLLLRIGLTYDRLWKPSFQPLF